MTVRILLRPWCWIRGHDADIRPRQPLRRDRIDTHETYCPRCGRVYAWEAFR